MNESQSARVLAVLKDGKPHSVPEIHQKAGTMRLNSRIADLRKKGHVIVCERVKGKRGAEAYYYQLVGEGTEAVVTFGQMRLATDDIAPRTENERFRIFRVKDGGDPEILSTAKSLEATISAISRLSCEGEFEGYAIGVQDARAKKRKGAYVGEWIGIPWLSNDEMKELVE